MGRGIGTDIVRRPQQPAAPSLPQLPSRPVAPPIARSRQPKQEPRSRPARTRLSVQAKTRRVSKRWWLEIGQYPLIAAVALGAAYSGVFGQFLIAFYIAFAVVTRRTSQLSFGAAVFLLVTIPLFQGLNQPIIDQNVATYVFELLAFGTAQAVWEQRKIDKTAN